jgi:hypothetical protein
MHKCQYNSQNTFYFWQKMLLNANAYNDKIKNPRLKLRIFLLLFYIVKPQCRYTVGGHSPIPPRREGNRTDFNPVGYARPLKLLGEKSSVEVIQPLFDCGIVINPFKCALCQILYFGGRKTPTHAVIEEKVMQNIWSDYVFRLLRNVAVALGR